MPKRSSTGATADAVLSPVSRFLGFDTSIYPGDQAMQTWRTKSPYLFTGYYLKAPCHSNSSWSGTRSRLLAMGWGFLVIYVGRQSQGPCSKTPPNASLGTLDGREAVARTVAEGFPPKTVVYLDVEAVDTIPSELTAYIQRWITEVLRGGFTAGVYCHVRNAEALRVALTAEGAESPLFWVAGGKSFDPAASLPANSGHPFAQAWQGRLDTEETYGGTKIQIDVNVSTSNNPSGAAVGAPMAAAAMANVRAPLAAPAAPSSQDPLAYVSTIIQQNLHLFDRPGVIGIRAGIRVAAGKPTGQPAIVVKVLHKDPSLPVSKQLPRSIDGVPVDVRQATPIEQLRLSDPQIAALLSRDEQFATPDWDYSYGPMEAHRAATARVVFTAAAAAAIPKVNYEPASIPLDAVDEMLNINCHASPDAGWTNLKPFLEATRRTLTLGMYDIGAAHIITAFESAMEGKKLTMVLDSNPTGPNEHPLQIALQKELQTDFQFAWAAEGQSHDVTGAIFPNAYHIKVAVRDSESMWLSSGNWMDSNQPNIDPLHKASDRTEANRRNREWHVIVDHKHLSSIYEKYIQNDLAQATPLQRGLAPHAAVAAVQTIRAIELFVEEPQATPALIAAAPAQPRQFFDPLVLHQKKVRIQPVLTPDNYIAHILPLIQSATKSFYMQTQYIHAQESSNSGLLSLVKALQDRLSHGVDIRLIVHDREAHDDWIEKLHSMGFDTSIIRVQPGIHNKGMVVDSKIAVVGSQNWSGDGVTNNRDASVILFDEQIAAYFEKIFLHDWTRLAKPYVHAPSVVRLAKPGEPTPPGFRRVALVDYLTE